MFCTCLLDLVDFFCCSSPVFPFLLSGCPVHYGKWDIEVFNYCSRTGCFSLQFCQVLLLILKYEVLHILFHILLILYEVCKCTVLSSCCIAHFKNRWCPCLSFETFFGIKSILSNISITTPAQFWLLFVLNMFFHLFTFSSFVTLDLTWVSCTTYHWIMFLCILWISAFWLES